MKKKDNRKYNNVMACVQLALASVVLVFTLASCETASRQEVSTESVIQKAGTVQLYHATETEVEPDEDRYQLVQPDNLPAAVEEVIENMTIDPGLEIERFSLDEEKNISLIINIHGSVTEETILLNQAAIVKSLEGLNGGKVAITLQDEDGEIVQQGTYTDASFYYYKED